MILDSSAVIGIFLQEPGSQRILSSLLETPTRAIGSPTLAETGIVLTARLQKNAIGAVARFVQELEITLVPFADDHWKVAVDAFEKYGKGRHPAGLNFGDCMTYAVAKLAREPVLCLGNDFSKTDLTLA